MAPEGSVNLQSFASVTHELRAPLHAIMGLADVLGASSLEAADRDLVAAIERQARAMQVVIDDLLDLSKIGAGKLELVIEPLSPRSLVDDVIAMFAPDAEARGLRVAAVISDELPILVRADGHRLRQVLVNLVSNAVKYTVTGSVTVEASRASPESLQFKVIDTGPGIPAEVLPRLFTAFEQATSADQVKGTGLGLSITRQIVDLMGGEITVDSSAKGSIFGVVVPVEPARRSADLGRARDHSGAGGRVLVVDDTEVNRLVAVNQLERLGHQASAASSGVEGLQMMLEQRFDAVLMDWHMPGINGLDVIRMYLDQHDHGGLLPSPIVMMTASVSSASRAECLEAGAVDFLPKPVSLKDLNGCLAKWIVSAPIVREVGNTDGSIAESIDRSVIDQMVEELGGAESVCLVVRTFIDDAAVRRDELFVADITVATRAAHTLKSTSRLLGAHTLSDLLAGFECALRADQPPTNEQRATFDRELDQALAELDALIAELSDP